jgi:hypothetical protein
MSQWIEGGSIKTVPPSLHQFVKLENTYRHGFAGIEQERVTVVFWVRKTPGTMAALCTMLFRRIPNQVSHSAG